MTQQEAKKRQVKAARVSSFGTTVFTVWTQIARETKSVNLGQGFPDFAPPAFTQDAVCQAFEGYQQYSPLAGMPALRQSLASQAKNQWGKDVNPDTEITITVGATEAIYASIQALVDPGDEVILMEPFYDSYPASITMAGGVSRYVPMRPNELGKWELDFDELHAAITPKTKLVMLNNPNNPTGKCFTLEELQQLADICIEHDLLVISDEVYDQLYFDDRQHHPIALLPGMWDRTVTISSVGKTFSVTGWKIGWTIAGPELTDAIRMAHQWIPFSVASPLQNAAAIAIDLCQENDYYQELREFYQKKRDYLVAALEQAGLRPLIPEGTYFITVDTSAWGHETDDDFCRHLANEYGVVAIPPGAFYSKEHRHLAHNLARFAFCKQDEALEAAAKRLHNKGSHKS